nr:hypothetical protein [Tanacetum cinerariifolium]
MGSSGRGVWFIPVCVYAQEVAGERGGFLARKLGKGVQFGLLGFGGLANLCHVGCSFNLFQSGYPKLQVVQVLLLVVQVRADDSVSAGGCTLPAGSYSFLLLNWFLLLPVYADEFVPAGRCTITTDSSSFLLLDSFLLDDHNKVVYQEKGKGWEAYEHILDFLNRSHIRYALTHRPTMVFDSLVKQFWATASVRTLEAGPSDIISTIDGTETTDPSPRPTFDFTAKLLSNMKLNWDGPHMPLLASILVVLAGGDAAGAATNEPTPDSSSPPSPPLSSATVGPTTSSRPPSPSRHLSVLEDIREGGGDFVSSPQSNEAPQTPTATAAGGAEDSAALTTLSLKLDRCLHRVTTLENELGITKKVLCGAVLKLVTRVKWLEGLLQQRKRRLVLSDSEGEDATTTEQEFDLAALHTLASVTLGDDSSATAAGPDAETTMPVHSISTTCRRLKKPFTSSVSAHVSETIPAGVRVPAATTTIPAGSSVDAAVYAAAAPSSSIPTAADKGKAPMVDD